ncbi:NADH dehydrogenase I chain F [Salmonella enterica subsp. enterica]|uniref:NADH dehydrogenase I chain F n=1 Tax=Salmonella enterica I TaxID=59201 RepID=A0A3S5DCT3_SALET|nr:NADH dehydrogenase I chain F [Salmonella enterica subsp. enterica]
MKILRALERGEGQPGDIETLEQLCRFLGPGKPSARMRRARLSHCKAQLSIFREEFEAGIKQPFSNTHLINGIQPNLLKERW